jgi:hypothetical protein
MVRDYRSIVIDRAVVSRTGPFNRVIIVYGNGRKSVAGRGIDKIGVRNLSYRRRILLKVKKTDSRRDYERY